MKKKAKPSSRKRSAPSILVTGDCLLDHNVYAGTRLSPRMSDVPATTFLTSKGGAWIVHELLAEMRARAVSGPAFDVICSSGNGRGPIAPCTATHALWEPQDGVCADGKPNKVWRLSRLLGFADSAPATSTVPIEPTAFSADVIIMDDGAAGFRFNPPAYPWLYRGKQKGNSPKWVLLKTVWPLFQGGTAPNWRGPTALPTSSSCCWPSTIFADRRGGSVVASPGERTAIDLVRELKSNPSLAGLRQARHVIVSLYSEGCLWMERLEPRGWRFTLVFRPAAHGG